MPKYIWLWLRRRRQLRFSWLSRSKTFFGFPAKVLISPLRNFHRTYYLVLPPWQGSSGFFNLYSYGSPFLPRHTASLPFFPIRVIHYWFENWWLSYKLEAKFTYALSWLDYLVLACTYANVYVSCLDDIWSWRSLHLFLLNNSCGRERERERERGRRESSLRAHRYRRTWNPHARISSEEENVFFLYTTKYTACFLLALSLDHVHILLVHGC